MVVAKFCFLIPYLALILALLLDGMARNDFFHLDRCARAHILCLDPFYSYLLIPEEKKNIWSELELNPGPLASHTQVTALTTRPWLLGLVVAKLAERSSPTLGIHGSSPNIG